MMNVSSEQDVMSSTDEWDVPLGGLPGMQRVRLERTHLEGAAAEVRFVSDSTTLSHEQAVAIWEGIGGQESFPVFEAHTQTIVNVEVGAQGAHQTQTQQQGWMLAAADRGTVLTLLPTVLVVQTRNYLGYSSSLAKPLAATLEHYAAQTGATMVQRLGLRYVNRLTDPAGRTPSFWAAHVSQPFAGALHGPLASLVSGVHSQLELRLDENSNARIHTGVFPENPVQGDLGSSLYNYLIDLDVFREQAQPFDLDTCTNQLRQLNRTSLALFATVLSSEYLEQLHVMPLSVASPQEGGRA